MGSISSVLLPALVPALVAGLVLAAAWRAWRRDGSASGAFAGAPAIGAGYLAAYVLLVGRAPLPGAGRTLSAEQWLFWIVAAAIVLLPLEAPGHKGRTLACRAVVALLVLALVPLAKLRNAWTPLEAALSIAALAALLAALLASTGALARRRPGAGVPACLLVGATALSACIGLTGSAFLAQVAGGVASALGAALVLGLWIPRFTLAGGGASMAVVALFGLGSAAYLYSDLPLACALLAALSALAPWIAEAGPPGRRSAFRIGLVRIGCALAPAALAVLIALASFEPDPYS